ncbi:uncharacterized protein LOC125381453 [Haliotis rufescens]|uniref:uncharacterized protein LOC125381453 n=1 Tax=Haliotis rufescens TaxID=6454 RepID=UPI00201E8945|nr:uncharacterized protein LOC125381453 [Haliotis rufescens]
MRLEGKPPAQKLLITLVILVKIRQKFRPDLTVQHSFLVSLCGVFFTFLRKSTLLPSNVENQSPNKQLCIRDVTWYSDKVLLTIRHSKTIQFGFWILQVPLCNMACSLLCPVSALQSLRQVQSMIPVTCHVFSFWPKVGLTVSACGLSPQDYSGHSFRTGGCTFALNIGMPQVLIKLLGDWKSNAFERYITIEKDLHCKFARALGVAALLK